MKYCDIGHIVFSRLWLTHCYASVRSPGRNRYTSPANNRANTQTTYANTNPTPAYIYPRTAGSYCVAAVAYHPTDLDAAACKAGGANRGQDAP